MADVSSIRLASPSYSGVEDFSESVSQGDRWPRKSSHSRAFFFFFSELNNPTHKIMA